MKMKGNRGVKDKKNIKNIYISLYVYLAPFHLAKERERKREKKSRENKERESERD